MKEHLRAVPADGFRIGIDSVLSCRVLLRDIADRHRQACTGEADQESLGALTTEPQGRWEPAGVQDVPGWHRQHNRRWAHQRGELLRAHHDMVHRLGESVRTYFTDDGALADALNSGAIPPLPSDPGQLSALSDQRLEGDDDTTTQADITDLDVAQTVWRRRRDLTSDTVEQLRAALASLDWHGLAAAAFTARAEHLVRGWTGLADTAAAIHQALLPGSHAAEPTVPAAPDAMAQQPSPAPLGHVVVDAAQSPSPATADPGNVEAVAGAHDSGSRDTRDTAPDLSTPAASIPPPRAATDAEDSRDDRNTTGLGVEDSRTSMAPAPVTPPPTPTPPEHAGSSPVESPSPQTLSPFPPMASSAAVAGATALAQHDRAHHVVRDIHVPPAATPTPRGATDGPAPEAPRPFRTSPDPHPSWTHLGAPGTGRDRPSAATPQPGGPPFALSAPLPDREHSWSSRRPQPPISSPAPLWVDLQPTKPGGAWTDLAADTGVGLHGAGATDVLRTAMHELLTHTRTTLVLPRAMLAELLDGHPHAGISAAGLPTAGRLYLTDDPYQALQALHDRKGEPDQPFCGRTPRVLIAPAPTTDHAGRDLIRALTEIRARPAGALLLGPWPAGTGLEINHHHQVTRHLQHRSGDLTGRHLHPTAAHQLAAAIAPAPTPHQHDGPQLDSDAADAELSGRDTSERTALALSVLGAIELRYRLTPSDATSAARTDPTRDEIVTVPHLPRPVRELLAFLAAHPAGATRETIVEALWPHSNGTRPEASFHTATSRLRRILRETTGTDDAPDPITTSGGRWLIDPDAVTVDYWTLLGTCAHDDNPEHRRANYRAAVAAYGGLFASDLNGEWAHAIRESARRRYLEIVADLAQLEIQDNPGNALDLLERARNLEPLNEAIYRSIIRIQLDHDPDGAAARHTYELLEIHLAHIDATPEPQTQQLLLNASSRNH